MHVKICYILNRSKITLVSNCITKACTSDCCNHNYIKGTYYGATVFFYHSTSIEFLGQSLVYIVINTNNSLTIDFLVRTDRESKRLKVFKFCHKMDEHKSELGRVFSSVDNNLANQE